MFIALNMCIIIGILVSSTCSFHSEKESGFRRSLIIAGTVVAIIALFIQFYIKLSDDRTHREELLEAKRHHDELKNQNDSLLEKMNTLSIENKKMKDMIANPKLEFLENRTQQIKDKESGKIKSIYVYRSNRPTVAIRDVKIELEFDKPITNASLIITKVEGGIRNENRVKVENSYGATKLTSSIEELKEGFNLIVEVFSDEPLNIVSNEFSP